MTSSAPHLYVASDLTDGMTLVEWRRSRTADRPRPNRVRRMLGLGAPT